MSCFRILSEDNMPEKKARCLKRLLCAAVLVMSMQFPASGGTADGRGATVDSCRFAEKIFFRKSSSKLDTAFCGNAERLLRIFDFMGRADSLGVKRITITGSASPEGRRAFNLRLSRHRADALWKVIAPGVERCDAEAGVEVAPLLYSAGVPYRSLRYAEFSAAWLPRLDYVDSVPVPAPVKNAGEVVAPEREVVSREQTAVAADGVVGAGSVADVVGTVHPEKDPVRSIPPVFLTTNLLYDAALTPNLGIGIYLGKRVTLFADWMHAWWSNRDRRRYWRLYGGDVEVRYHIGKLREQSPLGGHHIGVYGSLACYDFQFGRDHTGVLSDKYNYAVGISYTYSLPVSTHFNIDFNLGVGYLWGTYKKHRLIDDCDVWMSTHKMGWFGPTRAGVSLVWLLGNDVTNKRKGGDL